MDTTHTLPLVQRLGAALRERAWQMATAESCTGGLISAACTELPGSSAWFERGFVTYSNAAKTALLGVGEEVIAAHGAVSEPVGRAMAEGARQQAGVHLAVAVTGVAGPDGGSTDKPVGTVWIAWAVQGGATQARLFHFKGDRTAIRTQTCEAALAGLLEALAGVSRPGGRP